MNMIKTPNPTQQIKSWFEKTHPNPSDRDVHLQASEYLTSTLGFLLAAQEVGSSAANREELGFALNVIEFIQRRIRASSEGIELQLTDLDREAMLAALCTQIRACIGLAHMLEMDVQGALTEMADSDDTRLGTNGQPLFTDASKLHDGRHFRRPNYIQFI